MIVMTNLAIYTIALPLQKAGPCRTKFLTKSHWVIYKKKKKNRKITTKTKETKGKDKNNVIKKKGQNSKREISTIKIRTSNLDIHKNRYYHQPKAPVERIQSTFSKVVTRKQNKIVLFSDSILKTLRMGEFNSFIKRKKFP